MECVTRFGCTGNEIQRLLSTYRAVLAEVRGSRRGRGRVAIMIVDWIRDNPRLRRHRLIGKGTGL